MTPASVLTHRGAAEFFEMIAIKDHADNPNVVLRKSDSKGGKMDWEHRIRERAHRIWEEEGRPIGRHEQHWQRACSEIDAETRQAGARSGIPDVPGARAPSQTGTTSSSGLVGTDPLDDFPNAMGVDDQNVAGDLTDPKDNWPSTGRSKLVGT